MSTLARYLHTVRHLRPVQVYGRLWRRVAPAAPPEPYPPPPRRDAAAPWPGPWLRAPSLEGPARIRLLGDALDVREPDDWQRAHPAALWRYNLHYFDDLAAPPDAARAGWQRAWLARWLRDNPPGVGVGWEPYPTSLRLVAWIRWLLRGEAPVDGMIASLAAQARWLVRHLEHHLLGNHLFVNAKALAFCGAFFDGPEARGWLAIGERLLTRELDEQVLADGGHFERSPMYHALLLEDVLDLLALARVFPGASGLAPRLRAAAAPMRRWLAAMTHPDGELALFNDAALGVAAPPAGLAAFADALGVDAPALQPVEDLAATGYARLAFGDAVLLADAGALGPDYLPAHGHADTLSFELSLGGRRIVVDSGVSEYGESAERLRQRGTAAHNTVVVDGEDSSEVWGGFRVARRARVHRRRLLREPAAATLHAEHDGYHRLPGRPTHARTWTMRDGSLTIDDEVRGAGRHRVELRLHLAPGLAPTPLADGGWALAPGVRLRLDPRLAWELVAGVVHPRLGAREPAWIVSGHVEAALPVRVRTALEWSR